MSVTEPPPADRTADSRPQHKRLAHLLRRVHLYLGLLLLPWAVLYGVTAFLFNHPAAFSDQPTVQFGREAVAGTPMESVPSPREQAEQVIAKLNDLHKPAVPYTLGAGEAKYNREFAFATAKADGRTVSVLIDPRTGAGTVRSNPDKPKPDLAKPPFTHTPPPAPPTSPTTWADPIRLSPSLPERVKAAIPVILERTGFTADNVVVTSVPDLVFPIEADGKTWTATYNATTGTVTGGPPEVVPGPTWRQYLLRLHSAHGYPGETNARWGWAVVVDVMAVVLVFWGLSGLVMWWQVKATRVAGAVVLVVSAIVATALGVMMHSAMAG